jgi:hypothetical protein
MQALAKATAATTNSTIELITTPADSRSYPGATDLTRAAL